MLARHCAIDWQCPKPAPAMPYRTPLLFPFDRSAVVPLQGLQRRFRELRVLIRRLQAAVALGAAERRPRGLDPIRQLILDSFVDEERLMTALTYSGYHKHREDHDRLRARLAEPGAAPRQVGEVLAHFLAHHESFDAVFLGTEAPVGPLPHPVLAHPSPPDRGHP